MSDPQKIKPCSMLRRTLLSVAVLLGSTVLGLGSADVQAETGVTRGQAISALKAATTEMVSRFGKDGSYAAAYSEDGTVRRGKGGRLAEGYGVVQPPGMSSTGAALLRAAEVLGSKELEREALRIALHLANGQRRSGGWGIFMETGDVAKCDLDGDDASCAKVPPITVTRSTLDDNTTQGALSFLLLYYDHNPDGPEIILKAIKYGLSRLIENQHPNGACPIHLPNPWYQYSTGDGVAVMPGDWSEDWIEPTDGPYFVLNDHVQRDCVSVFLLADAVLQDPQYREAAERVGGFLLRSQLPAPQPGWAQAYDETMIPVWGRWFEPPAVATRETAGAVQALLDLHSVTGQSRYLDAAENAGRWLKDQQQSNGKWARFVELGRKEPIYVTKDGFLTRIPVALRSQYAWEGEFNIPHILDRLHHRSQIVEKPIWSHWSSHATESFLGKRIDRIIDQQNSDGLWRQDGWISGRSFANYVMALAAYIDRKS